MRCSVVSLCLCSLYTLLFVKAFTVCRGSNFFVGDRDTTTALQSMSSVENEISPLLQQWDADQYQNRHSFVWEYGSALIDSLDPKEGESVLDLGCGTGELAKAIADRGAKVIGMDADKSMVEQAKKQFPGIRFQCRDARTFTVERQMDAIFSNACLHWVQEPEMAIKAIYSALKPGGRFVAEFGGKGNVQQIVQALGKDSQWYFPSVGEYTSLLEKHGFEVTYAALFDRPTKLEDGDRGLANWLTQFGSQFFEGVSQKDKNELIAGVEEKLRSKLFDGTQWTADYRRIRIIAKKLS